MCCCCCSCVYLTVSCQHTPRDACFSQTTLTSNAEKEKSAKTSQKLRWTLSPVCSCGFWGERFHLLFFLFFVCLFFSLSLSLVSFVVLWLFDIITKTRIHKNLIRPSSLSFSLSSDDDEEEDAEERGGVAFASSLICASFLSFWSSEECKRKARRENSNFINFLGWRFRESGYKRQYHHRFHHHHHQREEVKEEEA